MSTNFQLKRLKLKLDIVEKPENRSVHKLTDSNVSLLGPKDVAAWVRIITSLPPRKPPYITHQIKLSIEHDPK